MPERAIALNADDNEGGLRDLLRRALGRNPLDTVAIVAMLGVSGAILANALYRQPGPHPAPIFSIKPRPVATEPVGGVVPALPKAKPETIAAPKSDTAPPAARNDVGTEVQRVPVKQPVAAVPKPMTRPDPIGDLITPASPRVTAVQRALTEFGYGPVKATGNYGPETIAAIKKFEGDRKMPVTGQISPKLLRELSAATGRTVE